ncbi:MAG: hypothetical protein H6822_21305 [Planctomycetaceae bacterium]|nr:carboxypeptidase regulatory-like domain-containing protein [Planctomycetales bacterium]MCB9924732.1 hypothetical protein [Planctomycetaceae bacterium]
MRGSFTLAALATLLSLGCSDGNPTTYEVRGSIRFPDGMPLTEGMIEFEALDQEMPIMATSEIDENGMFELGTFALDDGAVAGRHRAVIISSHEIGTGAERPGLIEPSKLHPRFSNYGTSGLEFEVKPGKNEFTIPVEYAPKPRGSRS